MIRVQRYTEIPTSPSTNGIPSISPSAFPSVVLLVPETPYRDATRPVIVIWHEIMTLSSSIDGRHRGTDQPSHAHLRG